MLCAQSALKWMLPAGFGCIVTVYGNLGDRGSAHVSAFAAAKAGIARFTETLATELEGTGVVAVAMHPGFVRTPMTEHLAASTEGQQWLPEFGQRAEHHWGDGTAAMELLTRITNGEADSLSGRIIHVDDDLAELTLQARRDDRVRHLRIDGAN